MSTIPEFIFSEGALQVRTTLADMRVRWRPQPLAEERLAAVGIWRPFWPAFRLVRPAEAAEDPGPPDGAVVEEPDPKTLAFAAFRAGVPDEVAGLVERFGSHQWSLMCLLHERPKTVDWAVGNAVLAYALANNAELRGTAPDVAAVQAQWYCQRRQREILAWLGFPDSEPAVRLLRKIPPESVSPSLLRRLRHAWSAEPRTLELLTHQKRLNAGVLELVINQHLLAVCTPTLLAKVAESDAELERPALADRLIGALGLLHQLAPAQVLPPFRSAEQVERFCEETDAAYEAHRLRVEEERRRRREEEREREAARRREARQARPPVRRATPPRIANPPFPPPPIPGTATIVPLTSLAQLQAEGVQQGNCVASYAYRVLLGDAYLYSVLLPERATLEISRHADGSWRRRELKATRNASVRDSTRKAVDAWLFPHRVSL